MSVQMRWEKVVRKDGSGGPGVRWGHTCNAIRGGTLIYIFGGYGKDQCQTNQVHVFDIVNMLWGEPVMRGTTPIQRDSHSCTTIGDNLFVFGGTDGRRPLNDLHILDTSTNTWILPSVRGDGPEPREGHNAALIGKRLFIFGGCGKSEDSEIYYDDLYILNTDTLVWCKLNASGQLLPPRGGHTTIGFGKNLFVFGGFSDEQNLYDDVYMLDIENGTWTKIIAMGEGPSGRFSMAGESLDPQMGGVLFFIGGCNRNLEALDDMYYLHTGLSGETERNERRIEKLSLRKQLKLKCQEQCTITPAYEKAPYGVENEQDTTVYQPMPISTFLPSGRQNFYLSEYQTPLGKRSFRAKVTKSFADGYTIETVIDGKPLWGVLFSNKPSSNGIGADNANRKMETMKNEDANMPTDVNLGVESEKSIPDPANNVKQEDSVGKAQVAKAPVEVAALKMTNLATAESSMPQQAVSEPPMAPDLNLVSNGINNPSSPDADIHKESGSLLDKGQMTPFS